MQFLVQTQCFLEQVAVLNKIFVCYTDNGSLDQLPQISSVIHPNHTSASFIKKLDRLVVVQFWFNFGLLIKPRPDLFVVGSHSSWASNNPPVLKCG